MKKPNKKKLMKELDNAWSAYVRSRDKVCQKCGGNSNLSAHHSFGRRHLSTRWDVANGVALCFPCHIHWAHRDICSYDVWFRDHIGVAQYERLAEAHNRIWKPTIEELEQILENIRSLE